MMNDDKTSFGTLLKIFRKRKGLTQQQIATAIGTHRNTIGRWEQGDFYPENKRTVLTLARHLHLNEIETRQLLEASFTALSPHWYVPYQRNPFFTGREDVLQQLATVLATEQSAVLSQVSTLSGLGGIGKTQTAIEYAYRFANDYRAVFWISAETMEGVLSSCAAIAHLLNLPECQEQEQGRVLEGVIRWLNTHEEWLLILDNIEDVEVVKDILPAARCGSLLFTTRRRTLGIPSYMMDLEPMTTEEGISFLLRRASRLPVVTMNAIDSPDEILADDGARQEAAELVKLLEGLPLALDQAGVYLEETGCSMVDYLQRCRSQRKQVLAHRGRHAVDHPASVTTTLYLSVQQVEQEHPAAAELVRLCAFLHPDAIPEELFVGAASLLGGVLGPVVADPFQFDLMLAALRSASLVARFPQTRTISIHRLVQAVLQDQMEAPERQMWSERIVRMVHAAFPDGEVVETWPQCERYLAQALACIPLLEHAAGALSEAGELFFHVGSYLVERGRYQEGEAVLACSITVGERQYGPDHPILIPWLLRQTELLLRQGRFELAEPVLRRVLALAERHLPPTHPKVAETLGNLAAISRRQSKYEQAESLLRQSLAIYQQQATVNPHQGNILSNLGTLYRDQGKYEEAEPFYQQALKVYEQAAGPEHPMFALILNNLATLYRDQGKYEQAEPLYQQSLAVSERQLGSEHAEVAVVMSRLARLYHLQERTAQAIPLYQRALAICEQQLGADHSQTVTIRNNYAQLHEQIAAGTKKASASGTSDGEERPTCPTCQSDHLVVRRGFNRTGTPRFRCRQCQHYFTPQAKKRGYHAAIKAEALALAKLGKSTHEIGKQLHVHYSTVSLWIKESRK